MADFINRTSAQALIPPEISREIIQGALRYSVALRIFRRTRNMLRDELLMPALSMLPQGGWLNSDNAIKPLTAQAWEMVEMYASQTTPIYLSFNYSFDSLDKSIPIYCLCFSYSGMTTRADITAAIIFTCCAYNSNTTTCRACTNTNRGI